ncbi:MAG: glycosyl hydrolase 115 family protein [Eubacteriales bacterium]|nr:glycosyl hydrolase 115 family protein [Eubacteriales bacterium]
MMVLNRNSKIEGISDSLAVGWAVRNLMRDIRKSCLETEEAGCTVFLKKAEMAPEKYCIRVSEGQLIIFANDERGFVYGLYHVSKDLLGIQEFWFWNDQNIIPKKEYVIPENYRFNSGEFAVKYRGWFVNDEVLLHTWSVNRREEEPWEMVFETLLRCGGNMVIPGTDKNARRYAKLASGMGLMITHHHAEPLGAEMFARAYPQLTPSYSEYPEKFERLWKDAIEEQKDRGAIWNLGFRGQGDVPFWENDPAYSTEETRGKLMGQIIRRQYDLVKERCPQAVFCTNLYGETMELYKKGCLALPKDVIKIWADNGYGKMVTRRQGNHNPRIISLPPKDSGGKHGIYYHVSFYDLQAANHMTMLPNPPEFVKSELTESLKRGAGDFWIINCSNVKPHTYYLDFIAQFWREGTIDISAHMEQYVKKYYGAGHTGKIVESFNAYWKNALQYGTHEDEHAGEQFSNHVARMLISQYMKNAGQKCEELNWAADKDTLREQIEWYLSLCEKAVSDYRNYLRECRKTDAALTGHQGRLYKDTVMLQAQLHCYCFEGAEKVCESILNGMDGEYQRAFYLAGKARKAYLKADAAMRMREHGKWHDFYKNECLTDIKQSAWVLEGLMGYLRNLGDGPHYYQWQREFLYAEEDRRVMLVMNMENHLKDDELFALMEEKWGDKEWIL